MISSVFLGRVRGGETWRNKKKKPTGETEEPAKSDSARQEYDISPEKFIEAWETANSAEEVAKRLGMPKPIVHARASLYRRKGVKLKDMPRHSTRGLDVDSLNRQIEQLRGSKGDSQAANEEVARPKSKHGKNRDSEAINPEAVRVVVEQVIQTMQRSCEK